MMRNLVFGKIRPKREDIGNVRYTDSNRNVAMHELGELWFTKMND
jgi:hypothetical protein